MRNDPARAVRWVGPYDPVSTSDRVPFEIVAENPSVGPEAFPTVVLMGVGAIDDGSLYLGATTFVLATVGAVYALVPLSDRVREPVRYLLLPHVGLSVLAGYGLDQIARRPWPAGTRV